MGEGRTAARSLLAALALFAGGAASAQTASPAEAAQAARLSDSAWSAIQYPAGRDVVVPLLPTSPSAAGLRGVARVRRDAGGTRVSVMMAAKMEMLYKKGAEFLGRRIGATDRFKLCDGSELKIESGRILETDEKCPGGKVIVQNPSQPDASAGLSLYAVDTAGRMNRLGSVSAESEAQQTFFTPLDRFMLVLSPSDTLTAIDARTPLAFRSAVPSGFAVVPFAGPDPFDPPPAYTAQLLRVPRPSQRASVTQTVGVTDLTITYSRPGVKGRKIWGDPPAGAAAGTATLDDARSRAEGAVIVPYGHVWRTGANEATTFTVTDDVLVNGQPLKAGTYSLHTIPGAAEWTIIFNSDPGQWGSFTYDEKKDVLRVKARPQATDEVQEWLTFQVEPEAENAARVQLRWEKVSVPFTVEVRDVQALTVEKLRAAVAAAGPDDWRTPLQAANYAFNNAPGAGNEEAMQWLEKSIKIKENFNNLNTKARVLAARGRTDEAVAAARRAIEIGRASNVDARAIADLEKRTAEWAAARQR